MSISSNTNKKACGFKNWGSKGSAIVDVVIGAAVIVLVILPVFSLIMEKYIIIIKSQAIKDTIDMANVSTYMALDIQSLGKNDIDFDSVEAERIFRELLAANLMLHENLTPREGSIAESKVIVDSLEIYSNTSLTECPNGTPIKRPTIHSMITVPVRPSLYRGIILKHLGKEYIELKVHVDSDIPVDNHD